MKPFWLVIFLVLIAGCAAQSPRMGSPTPTYAHIAPTIETPTIIAVPSLIYTKTPSFHLSVTPTAILIQSNSSIKNEECWERSSNFKNGQVPNFQLAIKISDSVHKVITFNRSHINEDVLINNADLLLYKLIISPEGKWLVGHALFDPEQLVLFNSQGDIVNKIIFHPEWGLISRWIQGGRILIAEAEHYPHNEIFSVNVFTGEVQKLPSYYPNIDNILTRPWGNSGLTMYDPLLELVVYPELTDEGNAIVLWNLQTNQPVIKLRDSTRLAPYLSPIWTDDGSKFAFTGMSQPLTQVLRDGTIFSSTVKLGEQFYHTFDMMSWSPDGRYLVFWLESRNQESSDNEEIFTKNSASVFALFIWDTLHDEVIDPCIPFIDDQNRLTPPVWSPDSRYLAVESIDIEQKETSGLEQWDVIVLDMKDRMSIKVTENAHPIGWLEFLSEQTP